MKKVLWLSLLLALCPKVVLGQRDSISLKDVEVRGVRRVDNQRATAPVQRLSASELVRLGAFGLEDALKHVAGVTVKDYGGAGGMKTASVRGLGAKHTAVSYDGLTLTDAQTGETDLSRYSLANMDAVSLTIGDGDNIFEPARNSSAPALLSVQTDLGEHAPEARLLRAGAAVGSWSTLQPSLFYRQRLSDRLAINVQGDYLYSENDYPFTLYNGTATSRQHRQHSRISSGHGEVNLRWTPTTADRVALKAYYNDCFRQLPGLVHHYTQDNDEQLSDCNAFGQAQYSHTFSTRLAMKAALRFNFCQSLYDVGIASGGVKTEHYWQREYYATTSWLYAPTAWLSASYSLDFALNNLNSTLTTATSNVDGPIAVHPSRQSVWQQLAVKATTRRLTATARLLWSHFDHDVKEGEAAANAHRFSPSLAASYLLSRQPELHVRASWKSIFRMPTFNELYYYHLGSATLKPERTSQWNVGLTLAHPWRRGGLHFSVDAYRGRVTDKIVAIPYNMFVWRTTNMASVRSHGVDMTLSADGQLAPRHRWQLTANYSWQRIENHTNSTSPYYGNQLAYTPEHYGGVSATWTNPWLGLTLSGDAMSHRWTTNEHADGTRLAGFAELSLTAFRTITLRHCRLTLRAALHNLLDKQYEFVARYPMPGRSWRVACTLEY